MRKVLPFLVFAVVTAVMVWQSAVPDATLMPEPTVTLPSPADAEISELGMSEAEKETLPEDTIIVRRLYRYPDGRWFQVSAVIGGRSKSSVHRPELCLPGQGYRMSEPHTLAVGGVSWRKLELERNDSGRAGFAYTFFNGDGFRTSSHLMRILADVWDRSVRGRIDRWVMVTVSSSCCDDEGLSAFLSGLEGVVR